MLKYGGYHRVPKFLLRKDAVMEVDLHLFLPVNDTIILYRRVGDQLTQVDCDKLSSFTEENLLARDDHKSQLTTWIGKTMAGVSFDESILPSDPIDPVALRAVADSLIGTLHPSFGVPTLQETSREVAGDTAPESTELLNEVAALVEQIVSQLKGAKSAAAYAELLQAARASAEAPLVAHQRQVSALAVIILMNSGSATMDDMSDLGTAGLVHDLGLNEITLDLRDRHIVGLESTFSPPEKLVYLRHPELALDKLKERKITIRPAVTQMIVQHHENWDGSGFKGIVGNEICRGARALRISDELVTWMSNIMNGGGLIEAFAEVSKQSAWFDPVLLRGLGDSLKS